MNSNSFFICQDSKISYAKIYKTLTHVTREKNVGYDATSFGKIVLLSTIPIRISLGPLCRQHAIHLLETFREI